MIINYSPRIVRELEALGLPIYEEHFLDKNSSIPCISYLDINDIQTESAETFGYSNIYYLISVYSSSKKELISIAKRVDEVMGTLGFVRTGYQDIWLSPNIGQRAISYKGIGFYNNLMEE